MNTETEAEKFFSKELMVILELLDTLPRNEREELLHHVQCSLADVNRMYGQVLFSDGYDDFDLAGGIAAIRAAGFEATIERVIEKDDPDRLTATFVAATGVSKLRPGEFLNWLTALVEPFGGIAFEAGYAAPAPDQTKPRPTDH